MFDKYFTPQEAEELLPAIERLTESIRSANSTLDAYDREFASLTRTIETAGGLWVKLEEWSGKRVLREAAAAKVEEQVEALQQLGVLLKDLKMGLVDFPSLLGDEEVFLCWKTGEPHVQYWHGTSEGYIHRKPLKTGSLPSPKKNPVQ